MVALADYSLFGLDGRSLGCFPGVCSGAVYLHHLLVALLQGGIPALHETQDSLL